MVTKAIPKVTAWSYSRWNDHSGNDGCPQRFKWTHLDKSYLKAHPIVKGPALVRGTAIHKLAEDYVAAARAPAMSTELMLFKEEFAMLRKVKAIPEGKMQFDNMWRPLTDWFEPRVWLRTVLDAHYRRKIGKTTQREVVIDYKTGKSLADDLQFHLYGASGLSQWHEVQEVEVQIWYTDQGVLAPEKPLVYGREELPEMQKAWEKRIIPMLTDKRFSPRPGAYCRYCNFSKSKGGPCSF